MKNYFIECEHNVYLDSYTEGETTNVNNFDTKRMYQAENSIDAIQQHLKSLGYDFKKDYMQEDEECEEQNKIWYSVLCDVDNSQATERQKNLWKAEKLELYANNMTIYVYKTVPSKI